MGIFGYNIGYCGLKGIYLTEINSFADGVHIKNMHEVLDVKFVKLNERTFTGSLCIQIIKVKRTTVHLWVQFYHKQYYHMLSMGSNIIRSYDHHQFYIFMVINVM